MCFLSWTVAVSKYFLVSETAIVSIRTLPVSFPLPTISKTSLFTLFCPLILDHGVCLKSFISGSEVARPGCLINMLC